MNTSSTIIRTRRAARGAAAVVALATGALSLSACSLIPGLGGHGDDSKPSPTAQSSDSPSSDSSSSDDSTTDSTGDDSAASDGGGASDDGGTDESGESDSSNGAVAQAEVEQQISDQLTAQVGQRPDAITCPGDLPAQEGAQMTCILTAGSDTVDVYVTVTSVDGSQVGFDIRVADTVNHG